MPPLPPLIAKLTGWIVLVIFVLVVLRELSLDLPVNILLVVPLGLLVVMLARYVTTNRKVFILIGLALTLLNLAINDDWSATLSAGVATASFITAFFAALTTLKFVAETSPSIQRCGRFLSQQAPGRRYAALTLGGQMFGLVLNYGSISLLGSMAMVNASLERNEEIRNHRVRRMLLAIQRGFISTLPWSPLSFAVAIPTSLIPGTSWSLCFLPGLATGLLLATIGWLLDTLFKPRLSPGVVVPQRQAEGNWFSLMPLLILLLTLVVLLGSAYLLTGLRVLALVMLIVPLLSLAWIALQNHDNRPWAQVSARAEDYLLVQLAGFRSEMILLLMAGYIGTVAAPLLAMLLASLHIDLSTLPAWVILVSLVWLVPLAGQIGMNPILAVALIAPVLPSAELLGISPVAIVVALTAGWILSGISSPFTATTMLVANFAGIGSAEVGQRWNGVFSLICAVILSAWVVLYAWLAG